MFSDVGNPDLRPDPSARAQALERSLEAPRARSVERLERLVAAARDLANEEGSAAFTVAQVSRRAGLSLKSFYRCFAGKDDLLVALLEEDSRLGASILLTMVDVRADPADRVRAYVLGVFKMLTHPGAPGYARMLVTEHRRLSEERPETLRTALAPMVNLLADEIARATDAGVAQSSDPARDARTIFVLVLEGIHEVSLGRAEPLEQAAYLWGFCAAALHIDPGPDHEKVSRP
ncbi:MAG: TetR/AcrR family transcriptional regulator [Acidimicrobiia bacterium]